MYGDAREKAWLRGSTTRLRIGTGQERTLLTLVDGRAKPMTAYCVGKP